MKSRLRYTSLLESEALTQELLVAWANIYPCIGSYLLHIPNGGYRNAREAKKLKRQGVKAGVSDLFLAKPSGKYAGLWLELKRSDKAKARISVSQRRWLDRMQEQGYAANVAYGFEEAKQIIMDYLNVSDEELAKLEQLPSLASKRIRDQIKDTPEHRLFYRIIDQAILDARKDTQRWEPRDWLSSPKSSLNGVASLLGLDAKWIRRIVKADLKLFDRWEELKGRVYRAPPELVSIAPVTVSQNTQVMQTSQVMQASQALAA